MKPIIRSQRMCFSSFLFLTFFAFLLFSSSTNVSRLLKASTAFQHVYIRVRKSETFPALKNIAKSTATSANNYN
jgi:hypothetical protein